MNDKDICFETLVQLLKKNHLGHYTFLIGFSGGLDSTVLLQLFSRLKEVSVRAVHIHHGLSPNADAWAKRCNHFCDSLAIPLDIFHADIQKPKGHSLEAVARSVRYDYFKSLMTSNTVLVTAHHQDDQAETLLGQLFRGAGIQGLSAMPVLKSFAAGKHFRPFSSLNREYLLAYANKLKLTWIDDESNDNLAFDRNFIRHQLMPLIKTRWPSAAHAMARSASYSAHATELHQAIATQDFETTKSTEKIG